MTNSLSRKWGLPPYREVWSWWSRLGGRSHNPLY